MNPLWINSTLRCIPQAVAIRSLTNTPGQNTPLGRRVNLFETLASMPFMNYQPRK